MLNLNVYIKKVKTISDCQSLKLTNYLTYFKKLPSGLCRTLVINSNDPKP